MELKNKEIAGRIYAIGDIHGCIQELTALLTYLKDVEGITQSDQLVFLGDYIDRGPSSKQVLETLIQLKKDFPATIFLRGNHEDMFLGFLGLGGNYGDWCLVNGGKKVFEEYELDYYVKIERGGYGNHEGRIIRTTAAELVKMFPKDHIDFILATEHIVKLNDTIFVHAGLNSYKPLDKQTTEDLFWVREDFLGKAHNFGSIIVHGHTIAPDVYFNLPYEVGIDTGCFMHESRGYDENGALSCIKYDKDLPINSKIFQVLSATDKVIVK